MENFAAIAIAESLQEAMADVVIRRITQHQPNGFIFHTRSARFAAFKIVMEVRQPALYPSEAKLPVDAAPSDFLMTLRKHLTSAELTAFRKPLSERVCEMTFKTVVPSKELATMTLVVELIPNAPNMILLDMERRVLASFAPLSPQHGVSEYEPYALPPMAGKIDLEQLLQDGAEQAVDLTEYAAQRDPASWLISNIAGMGPVFAKEVVQRQSRSQKPVFQELKNLVLQVQASHGGWIYSDLPLGHILEQNDVDRLRRAVLSPVELESMDRGVSMRGFPSILEAARFYFDELESRGALERAKLPALKDLRADAKRLAEREKKLTLDQQRHEEAEALQRNAQALVSGGMKFDQRYASVTVTDYLGDEPRPLTVTLNPALTLRENIDKLFKRSGKADRGKPAVARQIAEVRVRRAAVAEQLRRMQAIRDWDTWLAVSGKLARAARPDGGAGSAIEANSPLKRFRTATIDGYEMLVGRSSRENDELTFQVATPDDFWFHVAGYTGSHVVVRNPKRQRDLDEGPLVKAAQLAAFFSQARNTSTVEVHYTRRKNVAKPRRAKPGMVRLIEFSSVKVEPKNWLEG